MTKKLYSKLVLSILFLFSFLLLWGIPQTHAQTMFLSVSKTGTGTGTITSFPAGLTCSNDYFCSGNFPANTLITLTASESTGSVFSGWFESCGGTSRTCTFTLNYTGMSVSAGFNRSSSTVATPLAYLNFPGVTTLTISQGQSFTLGLSNIAEGQNIYYDQLNGPNGTTLNLGPIGTSTNAFFSQSYSTALWLAGTYSLVVYTKNNLNLRTSNNSNIITLIVTAPLTNPPPPANPIGYLDGTNCSVIYGWTCDADNFNQPLSVHFYADGPAGTSAFVGSTVANTYRGDLLSTNTCGDTAYHGFSFVTPLLLRNGRSHSIYAYGINTGGGNSNTQLSGSGYKTVSCAYAAPSQSLKYFGFAGTGDDPVQVSETMPFSNAPHMGVKTGVNYTSAIKNIYSKGGRPIIGLHEILFTSSATQKAPSGGADWSLHPQYLNRWTVFRATHASVLTSTYVLAFYMADEPTWNGISANDLKTATDLVAASYPHIPRIVVEAPPKLSEIVIPTSMSWISFDNYGVLDPANNPTFMSLYNTLKSKKSSPNQRIFIVGDAWWASGLHGANGITKEMSAAVALNYYNFAKSDPDVVALIGFIWTSFAEGLGTRDLPKTTIATWKLIGQSITGK